MTYKTIVVHVDSSRRCAERVRLAAELAIAHDAHLVGAAMTGISRFIYPDGAVFIETVINDLRIAANYDLDQFEQTIKRLGVTSYERRLTEDDAAGGLSLQSRYADLVVLSQSDPDDRTDDGAADILQYVLLNSARPVLAVPYAGHFEQLGRRVLIAWDGSQEATRAVSNALPLLKRAEQVTVALFNVSPLTGTHGQQPGADVALYLARHGVKVEVVSSATEVDIGNALLSQAADINADLLVMGGYGHSRFREILIGGVTRTILQCMTLPILLSH